MKKVGKIILPIATVATVAGVVAPLVVSCDKDQGRKALQIVIKGKPKGTFAVGEKFTTDGLSLMVTWEEGQEPEEVKSGWTTNFDGKTFEAKDIGTHSVSVTYAGQEVDYPITVNDAIVSIKLTSEPTINSYYVSQKLDLTGIKVEATYAGGKKEELKEGQYSTDPENGYQFQEKDISNKKIVKVIYSKTIQTEFAIEVKKDVVESIAVTQDPTKTKYLPGEKLDLKGMVVTATMASGNPMPVTGYTTEPVDGYEFKDADAGKKKVITVTYGTVTAKTAVEVQDVVRSISVTTLPDTQSYYVHEKLDLKGIVVTGTMASGNKVDVTSQCKFNPDQNYEFKDSDIGKKKISVIYNKDIQTDFEVEVKKDVLKSIEVTTLPSKQSYYVHEKLNLAGMVVTATMASGYKEAVTGYTTDPAADYEFKDTDISTAKAIQVTYGEQKTSFNVEVKKDVVKSIEVTTLPSKQSYYVHEKLNLAGMVVTATMASGYKEAVTGYTTDPAADYEFKDTDISTAKAIQVTYGEQKTSFNVEVKKDVVTEISIKDGPTTKLFYENQKFNTTGLVLTAKYASGNTEEVTSGWTTDFDQYLTTPFTADNVGDQQTVTVTYANKTTSYKIDVKPDVVVSISATQPTKKSYYVHEKLNLEGMVVTATMSSGNTADVTSQCSTNPTEEYTFVDADIGTKIIEVIYSENIKTQTTVGVEKDYAQSIAVTTPPTKTSFEVGEKLDLDGMVVTANMASGTKPEVTSECEFDPTEEYEFTADDVGEFDISISYGTAKTTYTVTVTRAEEELVIEGAPETIPAVAGQANNDDHALSAKLNGKVVSPTYTIEPETETSLSVNTAHKIAWDDTLTAGEHVFKVKATYHDTESGNDYTACTDDITLNAITFTINCPTALTGTAGTEGSSSDIEVLLGEEDVSLWCTWTLTGDTADGKISIPTPGNTIHWTADIPATTYEFTVTAQYVSSYGTIYVTSEPITLTINP